MLFSERQMQEMGRIVALSAMFLTACAAPVLEKDASYPADWPEIVGPTVECSTIGGTFLNKGVLVDNAGQTQPVWLTSLLPMSERTPANDPRAKERSALRSCERVNLQIEAVPWPDRPTSKFWQIVVSPSRQIDAGPPERWVPCEGFRLPIGRGWPFEGGLAAACAANGFFLIAEPGQIAPDTFELWLGRASDGSLVARWTFGPTFATNHVWARFTKLP